MGLLDCVASPERDEFEENRRPIARPKELSRSDHDISRRRALPLFASQTSLKNVRDIDFWRKKVLRFLYSGEGREDIRELRIPLKQLGYVTVTDFISEIPAELFKEYENQTPDEGIFKDDKIFWVRDGIAEPGIFKWQGTIDDVSCIGVQLDRKKAVPFGVHDGKGLFYCKPGHRALVPGQEITPYKKFLRRYLGLPPKRDSLLGSIRYSAKALAARNSKPGDRVYLPKEKKWATVIWIGKIDDETVVDLVYEPEKPASGKPLSPDEPCISRSMSLADFIGELESEPNSPMAPMTPVSKQPATPVSIHPTTPVSLQPASPVSLQPDQQTITATVESHANPSSPTKTETPPVSPHHPNEETDEEDDSDMTNSDEDETESEDEDDESVSESEHSVSDQSVHEVPVEEDNVVVTPPPVIKSYQGMENISTEILTTTPDDSATLSSPKRKGFFGFPQKQNKKAKSRSPLPIRKVEPAKDLSIFVESDHTPPQPPPRKSKSAGNLFANWKFVMPTKKPRKEVKTLEEPYDEPPPAITKFQKQKAKSDWGGMFKVRSKGSLPKLSLDDSHPSKDPPECQTPIDEMIPPDNIPTPPPDQFNERQIERPDNLHIPGSPTSTIDPNSDRSSAQSPLYVPPPPSTSIPQKRTEHDSVNGKSADVLSLDEDETDESDVSEMDDEASPQQVNAKVEMHVPPPPPSTAIPESDFSDEEDEPLEFSVSRKLSLQYAEARKNSQVASPEDTNVESLTTKELHSPERVQSPTYLEKFKEAKIRNRPSSFGSFLARIKNQPKKPDASLQPSVTLLSPTFRVESEEVQEQDVVFTQPPLQNDMDINAPATQRASSPSVSSVELDENLSPNEGSMQITKTLVKPPKRTVPKIDSPGNQEEIILGPLDVEENPPHENNPPEPEKTPKRKAGKGRTFSFTFSRKRKPSSGGNLEKELQLAQQASNEAINDNENIDPNVPEVKRREKEKVPEENEKERKQSITSSFRNSFRRTFSLTRKKQSSIDLNDEPPTSPPANITKPRPISLYIDNNEVVPKKKNSFRSKRPASVHVDIQPWNSRHGSDGVDVYSSPGGRQEAPASPLKSPTNPALTPKQPDVDIPKHRIFTTPAFFQKKNQKAAIDKEPLISKSSKTLQKKQSTSEEEEQPLSPTRSDKVVRTPSFDNPPSRPTSPPPPLPTAPPPIKRQPSIVAVEKKAPVTVESSPSTKLKSALKQRKEIDSIPKGLKINDRVLWYSGKGPVPGTVQKLFKDGTDKYTASVKFDREVTDEPLRLVREGDAYMVTVEELITPDMFGSGGPANDTPVEVITVTSPPPQTPVTPSVRFDGLNGGHDGVDNGAVVESDEDEEHDLPPPFQEEEVSMACGFRRGIQCQDKSCCLETILFSLFYTTNAFDISILYGNTRDEDSVTRNTRKILRKDIVDPLRRNGFCDSKAVKKLRDAVKPLSDEWQTLSTDAEVMMFILFDRALKLGKFISYSNEMSDFLHQLVVDTKDLSKSTTIQHLFEASLHLMDRIKLRTVPTPALILEMPRSNDKLMQYHAIIPNLSLHVSHLMDKGTRLCICGMVAKFECTQCSATAGKISIVYCDNCKGTADVIHFQLTHEAQLSPLNQPVVILDLVAIICVKGGHYSSFVKCGNNSVSPWVYFDGTEIENPKVCIEQNLGMWLDRLEKYPGRYQDALQYPLLTQILQDSHICIYQPREKSSSV